MMKVFAFGVAVAAAVGLTFDVLRWADVADVPYGGLIAAAAGIASMFPFAAWLDRRQTARQATTVTRQDVLDASASSMRWTCEQAGHPTQTPADLVCICRMWAVHVERGAVEIDCEAEEPDHG